MKYDPLLPAVNVPPTDPAVPVIVTAVANTSKVGIVAVELFIETPVFLLNFSIVSGVDYPYCITMSPG